MCFFGGAGGRGRKYEDVTNLLDPTCFIIQKLSQTFSSCKCEKCSLFMIGDFDIQLVLIVSHVKNLLSHLCSFHV